METEETVEVDGNGSFAPIHRAQAVDFRQHGNSRGICPGKRPGHLLRLRKASCLQQGQQQIPAGQFAGRVQGKSDPVVLDRHIQTAMQRQECRIVQVG